jgi:ribosomal protein S18 acetylase RimI-like enzyme
MVNLPLALQPPGSEYLLRPVRLSDAEALKRCCWPARSLNSIHRLITRAQSIAQHGYGLGIVALKGETAIAYGQFTLWPRCGEISDLIVAESERQQGVGTAIIQYLIRTAREMQAGCIEIGAAVDNPRALALYRRLGFEDNHLIEIEIDGSEISVIYLRLEVNADLSALG